MQRREFMGLLAGASAWPLAARAQLVPSAEAARPTIAFLNDLSSDEWSPAMDAMRQALDAAGFVEGRNVAFAYGWTEGHRERLPKLAADLVRERPAVIVASGHIAASMAARAATSDIPVVFVTSDDPVKFGLVSSLERPGANATGTYLVKPADDPVTRQGLMRQIMPGSMVFFALNINDSTNMAWDRDPGKTIAGLFATTRSFNINTRASIATPRSLTITSGPFLGYRRRDDLLSLVASLGVPALYDWRSFTDAGA